MIRVVQMGLGPIGRAIAARVAADPGLRLVGAVDTDPALAGRDLGELLGGTGSGIEVRRAIPSGVAADVVMHATGSFLQDTESQLREILSHRLHVVSTCEELAYPFHRHPRLSAALHAAARDAGAVLLGTGVNPGFVMDKLVVTLMSACSAVERVRVERVVDAATRREPFQRKIGAGITPAEFDERKATGRFGHIGLAESAHMLADVMGAAGRRELRESLEPVMAEKRIRTDYLTVEPGRVAGIHQTLSLASDGVPRVEMDMRMYVGAPRPRDAVRIDGSPSLTQEISSGVAGDAGTVNVAIDCAHLVGRLEPGLRTMLDVPLRPTFAPGP
jgi:4-hydroxy-tetrahydrodipicolinate reductase